MLAVLLALLLAPAPSPSPAPKACRSRPTPPAGQERLPQRAFKGVELYSWVGSDGSYRYSLLWGTNSNKSEAQIKAPECAMSSATEVVAALSRLADTEEVYWFNEACPKHSCATPSRSIVDSISAGAKAANVHLHAPERP